MNIIATKLNGLYIVEPDVHGDNRGFLWKVTMPINSQNSV